MSHPRTSGQRLYLPANSTQADFTTATPVLASGRRGDITNVGGELYIAYSTSNPNWRIVQLGHFRGARIQIHGVGTANGTAAWKLWTFRASLPRSATMPIARTDSITGGELTSYATGTLILGTATGAANDIVGATELVADTLTFSLATSATSPRGKATEYESRYGLGTAGIYTPENNDLAEIVVPDFGGTLGFVLEFGTLSSVTSLNAVYELTR